MSVRLTFKLWYPSSAEVSIGGWAVSFLLVDRDGGKDVGYVATGFWAGKLS